MKTNKGNLYSYFNEINEITGYDYNDEEFDIYLDDFINNGVLSDEKMKLLDILFKKIYPDVLGKFYLKILKSHSDNELCDVISEYSSINNTCDNSMFCQSGLKMFWRVEALVLIKRGYPRIDDCLLKIFEWFKDMNWPGSIEIFNMVALLPKNVLADNLEKSTIFAIEQEDYGWLYWLREVLEFNNINVDLFKDKNLFITLKNAIDM